MAYQSKRIEKKKKKNSATNKMPVNLHAERKKEKTTDKLLSKVSNSSSNTITNSLHGRTVKHKILKTGKKKYIINYFFAFIKRKLNENCLF